MTRGAREPSSDVELTFARAPREEGILQSQECSAVTACPQGSGAGHLCRLLGGLQGPWSCGTLCSKAMGITNPGAPRQAHGAPLSAGLSSGLCHLSLGTFSPSLPHPLPYFLLGTGGQTSGVVQGAAGRARLSLDLANPGRLQVSPNPPQTSRTRLLVSQTRRARCRRGERGREMEKQPQLCPVSLCGQGGIPPAESLALPSPAGPCPHLLRAAARGGAFAEPHPPLLVRGCGV